MPVFVLKWQVNIQLFLLSTTSRLQCWDTWCQGRWAYLLILKQQGQLRPLRGGGPPVPLELLLKQVLDFHKRASPFLGST